MTKVRSLFWLGVVGVAAVVGLSMLGGELPGYQPTPRQHTPPHRYAVETTRYRVIRLRADWPATYTPKRIMYGMGAARVTLLDAQLSAGKEYWQIDMAYDSLKTYVLEVYQMQPTTKATSCMIQIIDPQGFGFADSDVIHGAGTARCWVNTAA